MAKKKTWVDRLNEKKVPQKKRVEKDFADIPAGSTMFIATPQLIEQYIRQIDRGRRVDTRTLRKDLALEHRADYTCPVTTGIFLRIVAEASYEKFNEAHHWIKLLPSGGRSNRTAHWRGSYPSGRNF